MWILYIYIYIYVYIYVYMYLYIYIYIYIYIYNIYIYITTRLVKDIKDNVICFNKQQIKDAVAYLIFNCYLIVVGPKLFCQIIGIPMGSDPASFFANLFLYFYESKWMNKLKKNDLIK